jgi:hypothetical protein
MTCLTEMSNRALHPARDVVVARIGTLTDGALDPGVCLAGCKTDLLQHPDNPCVILAYDICLSILRLPK